MNYHPSSIYRNIHALVNETTLHELNRAKRSYKKNKSNCYRGCIISLTMNAIIFVSGLYQERNIAENVKNSHKVYIEEIHHKW